MNRMHADGWKSLFRLFRFIFWYGIGVAAMFYLLPGAALVVQDYYGAMSSTARLSVIAVFFAAVFVWQLISMRSRAKQARRGGP